MPLALNIGSDVLIAPLQNGTISADAFVGLGLARSYSLPATSTAGTMLLAIFGEDSSFTTPLSAVTTAPPGWIKLADSGSTLLSPTKLEVWGYLNNPGGIQTVVFGVNDANALWNVHFSEWTNVASASALEASGTALSTTGSTLTPTTTTNVLSINDLAISAWMQEITPVAAVVFTTPTGWTRLKDNGANAGTFTGNMHLDIEYLLNPPTGALLGPTLTSDHTTTISAAGVTICLKKTPPVVDQTAYLVHDSVTTKLNTADFALMLGGRLLLESSTLDGVLLEDGSGVLLLDTVVPSLGDPVAFTNPTWNGRVVSVTKTDIVDKLTNYQLATIAATNQAVATATTAPGDFSDVLTGGHLLLEDGSGALLLEDGSGYLLLEGTSFSYRGLSVKSSQNIDGTTATYGVLTAFETGFAPGQTFKLTSANLGYVAQSFTITNVTNTFIGANPPLPAYLIEFGDPYLSLQLAGAGVLTRQGSVASIQAGIYMPAGVLGYAQRTTGQSGITTVVDVTGLTVTVTVATGRRLQITGYCGQLDGSVAGDIFIASIVEDGSAVGSCVKRINAAAPTLGEAVSFFVIRTPTAGTHTYKIQLQRTSGTGTATWNAASTDPSFILVEDVGT